MSRYIDANKIKRHGRRGSLVVWQEIEELPTADVIEVHRGKWIDPQDLTCYKCSVCGEYATQEYGLTEPIFWHYCPNCGAKIEEDK